MVVSLLLVVAAVGLAVHDPQLTPPARAAETGVAIHGPGLVPAAAPVPSATTAPPATLLPPLTLPLLTPPTTAAPAPAPTAAAPASPAAGGITPYQGLGTWVDVYDWSVTYARGGTTVGPDQIARMVSAGVQTLYIQASKHDAPTDVLEWPLLQQFIDTADAAGLRVVVWYLPTLVDPGADLRRITAIAALRNIDGVAIDIEARNVADIGVRNRRLIDLSAAVRQALPGRTIAGIVLPPVALEVVNPRFWPSFPYREIAPYYDLWMTMGYWTNRTGRSGLREAYQYTKENVDRLRNNLGQPGAIVHPIGGIGNRTTAADVDAYVRGVRAVGGIGGSIYDWHTTAAAHYGRLRALRSG